MLVHPSDKRNCIAETCQFVHCAAGLANRTKPDKDLVLNLGYLDRESAVLSGRGHSGRALQLRYPYGR